MPLDVRTPPVAVDLVIELDRPAGAVAGAGGAPFSPLGSALPGGFVEIGETLTAAACREAREGTGLDVSLVALLGCYSDPARDPRWTDRERGLCGSCHGPVRRAA